MDAYRQGDARQWATYVGDDCVCAGETKADILKAIANRPPGVKNWYGDFSTSRPIALSQELLARYVGRYQYTPDSVDTVTLEGGHLFVQPISDPKVEILPEDPTTFFVKGEAWRIVFRTDPQGRVTSLVFRQQGKEYVASRLP